MKAAIVMGTRPEIIKLAPLIEGLPVRDTRVVFTGQHYDYKMGERFVDQLGLRRPDHALTIPGSESPGRQMARIIMGLSDILGEAEPDTVIIQGDTNTVLAAAVCSLKMGIPISHVEAGLRSRDWRMPEEHNRIATDHISDLLFAPTTNAMANLTSERVHGRVFVTGNTALDSIKRYSDIASASDSVNTDWDDFVLLTVHRAENVDNAATLTAIVKAVCASRRRVVFPVHPRTRKMLKGFGLWDMLDASKTVSLLDAVGYFEMIEMMKRCLFIVTDSGGIQEEATAPQIRKKTFVVRDTTDRPEAVDTGFSELVGTEQNEILRAVRSEEYSVPDAESPYGNGSAAESIISRLTDAFGVNP